MSDDTKTTKELKWEHKKVVANRDEPLLKVFDDYDIDSKWKLVSVVADGMNREFYFTRCL